MSDYSGNEQMLDIFLFETFSNIEQLEKLLLVAEKSNEYTMEAVNDIFRIMHTIKGSSAMMLFNHISSLSHSMEDLFYYIREQKPQKVNTEKLTDLLLEGVDYIKIELEKIQSNDLEEGDGSGLIQTIKDFLLDLKKDNDSDTSGDKKVEEKKVQYYIVADKQAVETYQYQYKATVFYEEDCEMENIRAYSIIHNLKQLTTEVYHTPEDIMDSDKTIPIIREQGFTIYFKINKTYKEMEAFFDSTIFLKSLELVELENDEEFIPFKAPEANIVQSPEIKVPEIKKQSSYSCSDKDTYTASANQNIISVNVAKLDKLMDLVGEIVISESLVTQNSDLEGLEIDNFQKAARQLRKLTNELQDVVMSIRMVPLAPTFEKMYRLVRDMNKKLNKETELVLVGEETEVDKNIIEQISDPLMHLVRNSIDHGIESEEERSTAGKEKVGKVTLEAKNAGGDVLVIIKDDGRGLSRENILNKAKEHGLLQKKESEYSDQEVYNMIFLPGFSTKESVSEYSGRGVGMDVVAKNIGKIGGTVNVDSVEGNGSVITLKIPLTLAIIDGMNIKVGKSRYTVPTTVIKESFRPKKSDIIQDPDGNEMILVRGKCYPILRLHKFYKVNTEITDLHHGILIMLEQDNKEICLFADELLGQQQVVVKALPDYIKNINNIKGISGCTLLGDGRISLIIDSLGLLN
jgi:Chemotaxis protein histidine kinase and related kinases